MAQRLWLRVARSLRSLPARLAGVVSRLRVGKNLAPVVPPPAPLPQRPAEVAQAAIDQAKASSRPATAGPKGTADDWEAF